MSRKRRNQLSEVFTLAWSFVKKYGCPMRYALKKAWDNIKLAAAMHKGVITFFFEKIDGTPRHAFGTLASNMIPATNGNGKSNAMVQTFYDVEKKAWRSFRKFNLI